MSVRATLALGLAVLAGMALVASAAPALAHNIGGTDAAFVAATQGPDPLPFAYLGAKHMVTGYDHLLFLVGVIFFLFRLRQIALYVSLFSLGHSLTLLAGVFFDIQADPHLVDAVIGLSVAYKAFDNFGGFRTMFGVQPDNRAAVLGFGLIHGFGLATKLQALDLQPQGLLTNLVSFNIGVEIGQVVALTLILALMTLWRRTRAFEPTAQGANVLLMLAGFVLAGQQIAGYVFGGPVG
ncbi:HupE/UreJ family protein [Phenylobacterium sp. J367]|uniref:HupE/UreJ family protein n=1 Tax=Phenylobacterium sp. J367 TaxID=2898435 RepID=UPI002151BDF3|nr:HupE/UreJ family protein [Phenylobacterium sp. J367]MCR5877310.1 HupE/UreJ family protein [Phenylobacterium sp. J367]